MKSALILAFLFPLFAQAADTYNIGICIFSKGGNTWTFEGSDSATPALTKAQLAGLGATYGGTDALCELATGTGDPTQLQVSFVSATATANLDVDPSTCTYTGTGVKTATTTSTIGYGTFAYSQIGDPSDAERDVIYLASPQEVTNANWLTNACNLVQKNMPN